MRKKKHPEHVNHERWLVSYADFITLLFAFFVVMFAVSQVDTNRMGRFTESFNRAVGLETLPRGGFGVLPGSDSPLPLPSRGHYPPPASELEGLRGVFLSVARGAPNMQGMQFLMRRNELVVRLPEGLLFDSGDAHVRGRAVAVLGTIAGLVRERHVDLRIEGHTDDRPIRSTSRYASNWELSTARATQVVNWLTTAGSLAPNRLSAAGYGEFRPVSTVDTDDGRRQNRRVDIVVSMSAPPDGEPQASTR